MFIVLVFEQPGELNGWFVIGSSGVTVKLTTNVCVEFELFVKVNEEFAALGEPIVLLQLEQLLGLVTDQEYETGTGVVPQVGKMELLDKVTFAGEHTEELVGEAIELVGGFITQSVLTIESGPQLLDCEYCFME
jgi:hypothetical protein